MTQSDPSENSPFLSHQSPRFQFSLGTLLIVMVVFSTTSAGFLWASRLPLITNELHAWMGTVPSKNKEGYDRWFQLLFLIFCYASPLLMVAILNLILACGRWFERITYRPTSPDDKQWEME